MKVLYLTNLPTPYRVEFFNQLGVMCDLTVLYERSAAKNRNDSWLNNDSINFKKVYLKSLNVGEENSLSLDVLKWISDRSYDLIVIGGYSTLTGMIAISYLRMKKIPFLLNSDGGFVKSDSKIKYQIKKYFISSASYWLSTSSTTDEYLLNYGAKVNRIYRYSFTSLKQEDILTKKILDTEKQAIKNKLNINYEFMIISVGQFVHRKGFDVLIKASKELSEKIGVYIVGGIPTDEYNDLIKEHGIKNVHFIDFLSKDSLEQYFLASDIFVLPTREDIWGLVVNEAMSHGLPVITTDKCGAGMELITNDFNGYIVSVNEINEIASNINKLYNNKILLEDMASNSIDTIQSYSIENMVLEHYEIFELIKGDIDAGNI